ncbi:putative ABC transporter ATP-binding protein [Longimycelium tulufanense]|uniref:Putative ABC transporter ATP-binding protein n=1 Tax=Longimycelium tulufanense TaxID=907463 RepID=A0A8J3FYB5_9PSEU|nr:putative ABC transporter ATP-binding protein [Longimycelium tulufanense]
MWSYLRGGRLVLLLLLLLQLASQSAALVQPLVVNRILDALQSGGSLRSPVVLMAAAALSSILLSMVAKYALERFGHRVIFGVRQNLASCILRCRVPDLERCSAGDTLSRFASDTAVLQGALSSAVVNGVAAPLVLVVACVLMSTIDVLMLLVVLGMLLLAGVADWLCWNRLYRMTGQLQDQLGRMTGALQRILVSFRTVKAFATEDREERVLRGYAEAAYRTGTRAARIEAAADGIAKVSIELVFLVTLVLGIVRVSAGALTVPELVGFLLYVVYLRGPISIFAGAASVLSAGLAAIRRIEQLRSLPAESNGTEPVIPPGMYRPGWGSTPLLSGVRLDRAGFTYGDKQVLTDVTFHAQRGLTLLVGPSGAGKTTVLNLIERFHEVERGSILLDGVDIRQYPRQHLRRKIAYVEQDAALLGDTLRAALLYGAPDAGTTDVMATLQAVDLCEWIDSLPEGLDTPVGERGITMSGGQRQRIAIARALLRQADVLILDEATSQLDGRTERKLFRTIVAEARARTVIAVTHRLDVARDAQQVVVLDRGRVHAVGRHHELLRTSELYQQLAAGMAEKPVPRHPTTV